MNTTDNNQIDTITTGLHRSILILRLLEWIHWILGLVLITAGLLLLRSAMDLVKDPRPITATWLILEVIVIGLHFVVTAILNQARHELDAYIARLRNQMA